MSPVEELRELSSEEWKKISAETPVRGKVTGKRAKLPEAEQNALNRAGSGEGGTEIKYSNRREAALAANRLRRHGDGGIRAVSDTKNPNTIYIGPK